MATARSSSATVADALRRSGRSSAPPVPDGQDERGADPDAAEFALGEGGLGAARAQYLDMMVSDASTAIFTVNAGGVNKTVSVYALGLERTERPTPRPQALAELRDHLVDIDQGGSIKTDEYAPERYRAILLEGQPGAPDQKAWPWPDIRPPTSSATATRTRSSSRPG